ncbi:uncharacterized protein BDZ83DRAFT_732710 [Colletotrichum acutatum]|uniref:Uncharacterized protein n=1 Tax=Glomerella acutata TaxID=27357 RepID=A0AAD8XCM2_GLOAC|nr:uncharacterized protein BDZ83DRAFT_732710 [Colletotrichum acutatum]KAK1722337.1 hypothetical protein BDZ83DRAFT_732710 [Colletotrichum acutatum]
MGGKEGKEGRKAQRDDNSCSPKRKWAGPGCEKGGRGRSLRRMDNGDFCTSYGMLLQIDSGSGRMSGKVGPRHLTPSNASRPGLISRLETRHSTLDTRARSGAWKLGQTFARQWLMAAMLQHPSPSKRDMGIVRTDYCVAYPGPNVKGKI